MNWKKFIFLAMIFLTFIATGLMLSSVQSREADLLLEAHGLGNNTHYFYPKKDVKISEFLANLQKKYSRQKIQLHLVDRQKPVKTLIWSNHDLQVLPTQNGRYFTKDDFQGQVSFAVLGPEAKQNVIKVQDNTYYFVNGRYYSVIGEFKKYHQIDQKMVYLTTGINQPTAQSNLTDYKVVIDTDNKATLRAIAHQYQGKLKIPSFVKQHQIYRFSVMKEIALLILLWIFAMFVNGLIATVQLGQVNKTHLKGDLLQNWVVNRAIRIVLIEVFLMLLALGLLRWRAFFNKPDHLILLLVINLLAALLAYVVSLIHFYRKDHMDA